ncbi:MAG: DUF309 domain-containing protein [Candidatus Thermoplasmatota archaeon]|nr:DUF309 domain-containing protein [Candidatus Thermoplasmatota archaeon]MCL5793557.1 DUF309 domain-containing protein [Candidatus Thermoplasmatota archaeon]
MRIIVESTFGSPNKYYITSRLKPRHVIVRQKSTGSEIDLDIDDVEKTLSEIISRYFVTGWRMADSANSMQDCSYNEEIIGCLLKRIRPLFEQERYWEAHEFLEKHWKLARGRTKQEIQLIIYLCVSMIKGQMGQRGEAERVYMRTKKALENFGPSELSRIKLPHKYSYPLKLHIS